MEFEVGARFRVHGRYEDFTDHLEGCTAEIVDGVVDEQGYVYVVDESGVYWYVRAEDLYDG